ncbi:MAG: acyl-CoA dehydrogenase [Proteobacteria bacterium]|nr:acyl-CoA dehydrogenase [Pseudomonadota bacterium]
MAQVIADRKDIDFVLFDQLGVQVLSRNKRFAEFNRKTIEMVINEARNFAIKEILPTFAEGDREGLRFENGKVYTPECFKRAYKLFMEGEWNALTGPVDYGGQGLPNVVVQAAGDYLLGANYAFTLYGWAGFGAGEMLEHYGTEEQKKLFLKKMYTGEWGGSMVLTESEAGSDVGNLSTSAVKLPDGTYGITGNKIFITGAEHDLCDNIINMVLARIEGASKGSRGISLFIVPKVWVNADGSLGELNDVVCTGIEEKMGIHASPTCSMSFGSRGKCRGLLLGEENRGMRVMFHMMNAARLLVGGIGFTSASNAFMHALNYARERRQGRDLLEMFNENAPQVPIIQHPDVRRMLLWMKAYVEGMRSLTYFGAWCLDMKKYAPTEEEREYYNGLLEVLTPVIKAYCTDKGVEICSQAIQVFGGYGYTKEYPVEQLLRDVRIAPIYEGTNGIQAMDLLGRKMGMKGGAYFMNLIGEIRKVAGRAKEIDSLASLGERLEEALQRLSEISMLMGKTAMSADVKVAFAHAVPFQDVVGDILMAWMLLWRATIAKPALDSLIDALDDAERMVKIEKNKNAAFYEGQLQTADYFIRSMLPVTLGKMNAIADGCRAVVDIPEAAFGGN